MSLLYEDLTSRILRCAFDVYNQVGPCFSEDVYQRAMEVAMEYEGLRWVRECPVDIHYEDVLVGRGLIDLLVENRIVLELKAVEDLHRAFTKQVLKYLWAGDFQLGIILNFGNPQRLQWRRVILDKSRYGGPNPDSDHADHSDLTDHADRSDHSDHTDHADRSDHTDHTDHADRADYSSTR